MARDSQAPKAGGDDTDEDEEKKELDHAADAIQGEEAQNVQADEKKEGVKAGTDFRHFGRYARIQHTLPHALCARTCCRCYAGSYAQ